MGVETATTVELSSILSSLSYAGPDRGAAARPRAAQLPDRDADRREARPAGRRRDRIPLLARIVGLAQVAEIAILRSECGTGPWPDSVDAAERLLN